MQNPGMEFELSMRILFGDKASHIAGQHLDPVDRRKWLTKALREVTKRVDDIATTVRHKKMMVGEVAFCLASLKGGEPPWSLVYGLLRLVLRLLGYDYMRAARCHTVEYWQEQNQRFTTQLLDGEGGSQQYYERDNAIALRQRVARQLRADGHDDYMVGLVLGVSEYQARRLCAEPGEK